MNSQIIFHTDDMSIELRLLLAFLSTDQEEEFVFNNQELLHEADWNRLIELARHHSVYNFLIHKLQALKLEQFPLFVTQLFQRDNYQNTLKMLGLSGEMEQITKAFSESGVRSLFLQVPILSADLYGDLTLSTTCDLNLLVPPQELERARQLLETLGYVIGVNSATIFREGKWWGQHITLIHPNKGIKVELYWRLNVISLNEAKFNELWDRKREHTLISRPIYYLGKEDLFVFIVCYGAHYGWSRLRWLLDLKDLVNQNLNWCQIIRLLKKRNYTHVGGQAMLLAARLLSLPLREEMKPLLASRKAYWLAEDAMFYIYRLVDLQTSPMPEEVYNYHKRYLFNLLTLRQKMIILVNSLSELLSRKNSSFHPIQQAWKKFKKQA